MSKYLDTVPDDDDCISVLTQAESMLSWHSAVESLSRESLCTSSFYSAKDMRRLMAKAEDRCMRLKDNIKSASTISIIEVVTSPSTISPISPSTSMENIETVIPHLSIEDCPFTEDAVATKLASCNRRKTSQLVRAATTGLFTNSTPTTPGHSRSNTLTAPGTPNGVSKRFSFDLNSLHHSNNSRQTIRPNKPDSISEGGRFDARTSFPSESEQSTPRASISSARPIQSFARTNSYSYSTFPRSSTAPTSTSQTPTTGSQTSLIISPTNATISEKTPLAMDTTNTITPLVSRPEPPRKRSVLDVKFNTTPTPRIKRRSVCGWVNKYILCSMIKTNCPEWNEDDVNEAQTYVFDGVGWMPENTMDEKQACIMSSTPMVR